jgi:hypothetical protein
VLGHSSGAVIALYAASLVAETGVPVRALFLSEPPFHFGIDEPAPDLPSRIQAFVDAGDREEAVVLFQREAVGLPDAMIAQFRATDAFAGVVPLAQSTVYDATLARELSTPTDAMLAVDVPVTILCGQQTFPFLSAAAGAWRRRCRTPSSSSRRVGRSSPRCARGDADRGGAARLRHARPPIRSGRRLEQPPSRHRSRPEQEVRHELVTEPSRRHRLRRRLPRRRRPGLRRHRRRGIPRHRRRTAAGDLRREPAAQHRAPSSVRRS